MIAIYYIGGPWDLHKVAVSLPPNRTLQIRVQLPLNGTGTSDVRFVDHEYIVRPLGKDVFAAIHSEIYR